MQLRPAPGPPRPEPTEAQPIEQGAYALPKEPPEEAEPHG
jgi:hypothetical protein